MLFFDHSSVKNKGGQKNLNNLKILQICILLDIKHLDLKIKKLYTNCLKRDGKGEHILPSTVEHKAGLRRKLMAINAVIVKKK